MTQAPRKILAIASAGGHWEQLMRLRPAFEGHRTLFLTTLHGLAGHQDSAASIVPDCNANAPLRAIYCAFSIAVSLIRFRPHIVISTGALPGLIALGIGKSLGARTIWIDSVANAEEFSMAGKKAKSFADIWLSQWPHVAQETGAEYWGNVL